MDAGIPVESGATTINKLCGSGMKATMLAHDLIKAGTNDIMVAGHGKHDECSLHVAKSTWWHAQGPRRDSGLHVH